jgi:acyl carrier protein
MMKTSVREIVANILGVSPSEIQASSSPRDFAQWDSAAHLEIVLSAEAEYAVSFTPEEMIEALSVGALEDVLRQKGARLE